MKIRFIRHLPTTNNITDTFIGQFDIDCDKEYIISHESDILIAHKKFLSYDAVYSSPLLRAISTAKLVLQGQNFIIDKRLIERDLGTWSNVSKQKLRNEIPDAFYPNGRLKFSYTPVGGESFDCLVKRVSSFMIDMHNTYSNDSTVLAFTHNGIITTAKCIMTRNLKDTSFIEFQPYLESYDCYINSEIIYYLSNLSKS